MNNHTPKVSVLLPTYNRPDYIKDAIESVVQQMLTNWELWVVNDGGEDVRRIVEGFDDARIHYINRKRNRGKAACLNLALKMAVGDYVAYIDDDDKWYANHLDILSKTLDENPQAGARRSGPTTRTSSEWPGLASSNSPSSMSEEMRSRTSCLQTYCGKTWWRDMG